MSREYMTTRRVEFRDTDAGGIMHFSSYFAYMEAAEHEMLRHLGLSVVMPGERGGYISWPRVSAKCDYDSPAKFEELLEIGVRVAHIGKASVRYTFHFRRAGRTVARGEMTTVCCRIEHGKMPRSIPIPDAIRNKLRCFATADSEDGQDHQ
jgi:4-hydroxybenzoyl-CoA thioesterase/acyl-CoA thioester hydrolase